MIPEAKRRFQFAVHLATRLLEQELADPIYSIKTRFVLVALLNEFDPEDAEGTKYYREYMREMGNECLTLNPMRFPHVNVVYSTLTAIERAIGSDGVGSDESVSWDAVYEGAKWCRFAKSARHCFDQAISGDEKWKVSNEVREQELKCQKRLAQSWLGSVWPLLYSHESWSKLDPKPSEESGMSVTDSVSSDGGCSL